MAHSEAFLQREIDSMRELLDKSVDGIFAFDRQLQITHWNSGIERITGVSREVAIGRHVFEPFPYLRSTGEIEGLYEVLTGANIERKSLRVVKHASDQIRHFDVVCSPLYDSQGRIEGGAVVVHDITEQKRVEEALQASNELISNILESITDAFFALDRDWKFTYVNKMAGELLQRNHEELVGKCVWDEFSHAVELAFFEQYHIAMNERVGVEFEAYYPPLDTWFDVRAYPGQDGLSVYFRDVTKHKRVQDEHDQYYKSLFEQNPDAVFSLDLSGCYLSCNRAMEKITGYRSEDLLHRSFEPLVAEKDLELTKQHFELAAKGIPQTYEVSLAHREGRRVEVHVTNIPIIVNENVVGVYGMAKDITERTCTEEELRTTKEQLESFIRNNADAIWMVDLEERVQRSNASFERMFGWPEEELYGNTLPIIPDFLAEDMADLHRRVKNGESFMGFETQRLHKNGSLIYVSATLSPIRDVSGNVIGITGICRDISNSKKTEELLLKSEKLAVAGQLAAGVAHEIRNPLTALKGFVQLMQVGGTTNEKYLQVMASELNRIELIISELLVLAKPQALIFKQKNVLDILEDVITISETQAILKNVQIVKEFEQDIPLLDCDENQLKQVFINFLKNAIESMQRGGQITVQVKRCSPEQLQVRFSDQGCGIPQEILARLGEPFYTTKEKGTGLGLMVSHKIIENHAGKIFVTSEVNVGTTIDVFLPFVHQG